MPNPNGSLEVQLNGAAAVSATDVWAVGASAGAVGGYSTLIEHWNGSSWAIVPSPAPPNSSAALFGVAALSSSNVWAVGTYHPDSDGLYPGLTLVLHWNGVKWKRVASPNPGQPGKGLAAVAAISPRSVWAVGTYTGTKGAGELGTSRTLTLHWNGRKWKQVPSPNLSGNNALMAVAAVGRNDVEAVGGGKAGCGCKGGGTKRLLAEHWNGHTWRIEPVSSGFPGSNSQALTSLGVASGGDVWAVGYHQDSTNLCYYGLIEHWDGSYWSVVPSLNPDADHFSEVAAASPAAVWAVGTSGVGC